MTGSAASVAVVLTPPGVAAIAVIRLSGPMNAAFAERHLTRVPRPGRCVHCDLTDDGNVIDDVVVVRTDDGALDLNLHGGVWVVQATLNLARAAGFRVAAWTDSAEAWSDTDDAVQRQMMLDLPRARSRVVLRLLAAQPAAWRGMLADADPAAMRLAIDDVALERALAVPTVAIVGPPNVGKSTLANALFAQERSITADVPGTTRDWVGELADLDGLVVRLVDTPGVRKTRDTIEAAAIRRAGEVVAAADWVVIAIDGSRPLEAFAASMLDDYPRATVVRTKADLPTQCAIDGSSITVSALCGDGLDALRFAIRVGLGCADLASTRALCWTADQRDRVRAMLLSRDDASTIAADAPDGGDARC